MTEQSLYSFPLGANSELYLDVPKGVFTPTGTTKVLFKAVLEKVKKPGKILDLGCGCGVMGIALHQKGLAADPLYASDLSEAAVLCTQANASKYRCPITAKAGPLFEPWADERFDCIVDDVSGVSEEVAKISPWFDNVPCDAGLDGTSLVVQVIKTAPRHLNPGGCLFFPIVSFSNPGKIIKTAQQSFEHVERIIHEEWPLPKEMNQHIEKLKELQAKGCVQFAEKFGLVLWFTDVYVAYNGTK